MARAVAGLAVVRVVAVVSAGSVTVVTCSGWWRRCAGVEVRIWVGVDVGLALVPASLLGCSAGAVAGGTLGGVVTGVVVAGGVVGGAEVVSGVVVLACLMPDPNSWPLFPLSGGAPRAVASGNAYSFATGLAGSMCSGEPLAARAAPGSNSAQLVQASVCRQRARTLWRIAALW